MQYRLHCHCVPLPSHVSLDSILDVLLDLTLPGLAHAKPAKLCCDADVTTFAFNLPPRDIAKDNIDMSRYTVGNTGHDINVSYEEHNMI